MSIGKFLRNLALVALVACPLAVSCDKYDDSAIRQQLESLVDKVFELEQKMNSEIDALNKLLDGKLLIEKVTTDSKTGITTILLTNGNELELLPEKDLKSFVTYITSGGVDYWAYIDEKGQKQYFLDKNGEAFPVKDGMPKVVVEDEDTYLVLGGNKYPLSGNSVFSDYDVITDELTEEVLAVTFTFGENMSFTVTVDGAAGLLFVQKSGISSTKVLKDYFVAVGTSAKIQIQEQGVVDYVLQIPDGWRVKDGEDALLGKYFEVTAPAASLIESGVAIAEGELKVMAVLEGGKATVAKLNLTTEPFKEFVVSAGNATVKRHDGLYKYIYGVCDATLYDETTILAAAEALLESESNIPAGYGVSTDDINAVSLSELVDIEMVAGNKYTFWVIPALYSEKDAEYYLMAGTFEKTVATYGSVKFEVKNPAFRDAQFELDIKGATSYYFRLVPKADYDASHVVNILNTAPESYTAKTEPMTTTGSIFEFAGVTAVEDTEYVAWIVISNDGREYLEADVITCEFATLPYTAGSSVLVTAAETEKSSADVTVALTATGAERIYYAYFKSNAIPTFASDEAEVKYIMENGKAVVGTTAETHASDCIEGGLDPESKVTLFALATDATGKYSEVFENEYVTAEAGTNNLLVNLSVALNTPDEVKISVSTAGGEADSYLYWIGLSSASAWTSKNILGGSAKTARAYMVANADHSRFTNVARDYPMSADGVISIKNPKLEDAGDLAEYVVVIMAKDASGLYSEATVLKFFPHSVDIGNIVPKTADAWKTAESSVKVDFIKERFWADGEFASYSYKVSLPQNYTAYVLSGTDSFFYGADETVEITAEKKILKIISEVDYPKAEYGSSQGDDGEIDLGWQYEHGSPKAGGAVIWANATVHDSRCTSDTCNGTHTEVRTWFGNDNVTVEYVVLYNTGASVEMTYPYAAGNTGKVVDKVFIVLQDLDGNCYEPYEFNVPYQYWEGGAGFGVDGDQDNSGE